MLIRAAAARYACAAAAVMSLIRCARRLPCRHAAAYAPRRRHICCFKDDDAAADHAVAVFAALHIVATIACCLRCRFMLRLRRAISLAPCHAAAAYYGLRARYCRRRHAFDTPRLLLLRHAPPRRGKMRQRVRC